ncbi:MAG: hypothetical protein HUU20_02280 [Pirellulales bacterium]|nr:hypothetical protein [Pirellulales bacterium]
MLLRIVSAGVVLGFFLPAAWGETRTWTDQTGKLQVEAEYVGFSVNQVVLRRPLGDLVIVPVDELSRDDRRYVDEQVRQKQARDDALQHAADPAAIHYGRGRQLAILANRAIDESSGIAASRRAPGVFWTHNDSGDDARIFAFDTRGRDLGACRLDGVDAYDWEDIASFTWNGKSYLLIGDTGNNGLAAAVQMLHVVEEPAIDPDRGVACGQLPVVQTIYFSYEDDHRNCEAVAVDPTDHTVVLATKERSGDCLIYALAWPEKQPKPTTALIARRIASAKVPSVTGMDIAPDGRRAVLLTYLSAFEFTRALNEPWSAAFSRPPREIAVPDRLQGESICYGADGNTLYLTSEKLPTPLFEIPVKNDASAIR